MRYKLTIEYDGSRYAGWQLQTKDRTVQGELIAAATTVLGIRPVELYGSGRTDAGVHARKQIAHLDTNADHRMTLEQLRIRMNDELPHDINILQIEKTHPKFHARYDAKERVYVYYISKRRDAFAKKHVWWIRDTLNTKAMRAAAANLVGFHDFKSFGSQSEPGQSTLVELKRLEIKEDDDRIYITVAGSHFLWKMVRRIVGVLVETGRGRFTPDDVERFLTHQSQEPARLTAPPSGLFLEEVHY